MFEIKKLINNNYDSLTLDALFELISQNYSVEEDKWVKELQRFLPLDHQAIERITKNTAAIITDIRQTDKKGLIVGIDAFLQQYSLDTEEGIVLMCLAEALLRIPDAATADKLIKDKLGSVEWEQHLKQSDSLLVNASTWGLMLTGKIISLNKSTLSSTHNIVNRLVGRMGESIIRQAIYAAMKMMGKQFVLGQNINEAIANSISNREKGYTHSFDMLGEAAITRDDANYYLAEYSHAIQTLGQQNFQSANAPLPTISIKLSALHPRYDAQNEQRVLTELYESCIKLIHLAKEANVGLTIDAEEMDRLELSLKLFEKLYQSQITKGWKQLGIVVQAYSKRALPVLCWLNKLATLGGDEIPVRLVKGAYWDSEIKWAQVSGLDGYPVFTRKAATDLSYLACAKYLLSRHTLNAIYPQFASHNAQTVAAIIEMSDDRAFEFQRLHGMGQELYDPMLSRCGADTVRIYAPVGSHKELLPYLVRRLLENGANSSFIHKLVDPNTPIESLTEHPLITLQKYQTIANPNIQLPENLFVNENIGGHVRKNANGINLAIQSQRQPFLENLEQFKHHQWRAHSLIQKPLLEQDEQINSDVQEEQIDVFSPYDNREQVGSVLYARQQNIDDALTSAAKAFPQWKHTNVTERSQYLFNLANLLELHKFELYSLCIREAGKTLQDSIDEIREAIDFCRFYALHGEALMCKREMPSPTGETNILVYQGKGTFVCISPWNFPLAIFLGQITAALVTGNCVIAKPAEQTSLIAFRAVQLAYEAGIPETVLQLVLGTGKDIGNKLIIDSRIGGVCFTGSTVTAKHIHRQLAAKEGAIIPLIAETGGQNVMIVDSTALPEQVIKDVISSAFSSAGQRCSALRVLYIQNDIADKVISLLQGAMAELVIDYPAYYYTDLGSVIDENAQHNLSNHIEAISKQGNVIFQSEISSHCQHGYFVPPFAVEIDAIDQLKKEQFGPILHVIRYKSSELKTVIGAINNTGYGLTLGIHSRNESFANELATQLNVGNIYINRNQIGAVVGSQPFGGQGLSGTGPKAGGPNYLRAFLTEKTITNNIAAIGGNTGLLSLDDNE